MVSAPAAETTAKKQHFNYINISSGNNVEVSDSHILSTFKNQATREEGLKMLMHKYQQRLYWVIRRMVIVHEDADDVLQNVFIKVWNNLDRFQEQSQLYTWLYRIAINETLTFLKRRKRKAAISLDDEESFVVQQLKADVYFNSSEMQEKLQRAIASLPPKQKAVFVMRYYDELSYEQMSEMLGTSVGALKASYHHALKKIESFLTED
ncbi:MAG: DNA-directed RNA polymerase sigma-70 factor [Chitinophagales bacterium]|nr:MAG: DNA-directed RNA polymerase sigma-70 factor [Chitinophagales bacterium]